MAMKESTAKTVARRILNLEILPQLLSAEQLISGHFLILMGPEPREIEHLDTLGVQRNHIWSVERNEEIYQQQQALRLGVSLFHGDMHSYLDSQLHRDQRFHVLNLDIEGSYLVNLDPAMSSVLLFCWRNPETVVAMSWSIGRDTETLLEGLKSLAFFLWVTHDETIDFALRLAQRYAEAEFEKPFHMVLRDLFWLRSMLEHTLVTAMWMDVAHQPLVRRVLMVPDLIGEIIWLYRKQPITLRLLQQIVTYWDSTNRDQNHVPADLLDQPTLGLEIATNSTIIYRAIMPWSQEYQATKFACASTPVSIRQWIETTMERFLQNPFIYVDRAGIRSDIGHGSSADSPSMDDVVCDVEISNTEFKRQLDLIAPTHLRSAVRTLAGRRVRMHSAQPASPSTLRMSRSDDGDTPPQVDNEKDVDMATKSKRNAPTPQFMRDGELTDHGKTTIRELAAQGLNTDQIMDRVPESVPKGVIRAHVAVSRRKKS